TCPPRRVVPGVPRAASTPAALITRRRCCLTARCWWQADLVTAAILPVPNCTTRVPGAGVQAVISTPHAIITRRRCCPTARCWWPGELLRAALLLRQKHT